MRGSLGADPHILFVRELISFLLFDRTGLIFIGIKEKYLRFRMTLLLVSYDRNRKCYHGLKKGSDRIAKLSKVEVQTLGYRAQAPQINF